MQHNIVRQLPTNANYPTRRRNYDANSNGVTLDTQNMPSTVASFEARRIVEGGELGSMVPPITTTPIARQQSSTCSNIDREATEDTVTLHTLTGRMRSHLFLLLRRRNPLEDLSPYRGD